MRFAKGIIGCSFGVALVSCNVPKSAAIKVDINRNTNPATTPSTSGPEPATGTTVVTNTPSGTTTTAENPTAVASPTNINPGPVQTQVPPTMVNTAAQELAQLVSQFDPRLTAYTSNQYTLSDIEKRGEACVNDYLNSVKVTVANKIFSFSSDKQLQTCMNQAPALVSAGKGAFDYSSRYMIQVSCDGNVEIYNGKSLTDDAFMKEFCAQGTKASVSYSVELNTTEKNPDGTVNRQYRRMKTLSSIDGQGPCTYTLTNGVRTYTNCAWSDKAWSKDNALIYQAIAQFPAPTTPTTGTGTTTPTTGTGTTTPTTGTGTTTPTTGTGTTTPTTGTGTTTPTTGTGGGTTVPGTNPAPLPPEELRPFMIVINNLIGRLIFDPLKPDEVRWELGAPGLGPLTSGVIKVTSLPSTLQMYIIGLKGTMTVPVSEIK